MADNMANNVANNVGDNAGRRQSVREDLRSERMRFETYANWPRDAHVRPRDLARNGFYYTGEGDSVRCFHCSWRFHSWRPGDDPAAEHAVQNPECQFHREYRQNPNSCGNIPVASIVENPHWNGERQCMTREGDRLNYHTYAQRLVEMLSDPNTTTPLTVGLFANWGQGKSAVLELCAQCIQQHNKDNNAAEVRWYSHVCYCSCPGSCSSCCRNPARRPKRRPEKQCKRTVRCIFCCQILAITLVLSLVLLAINLAVFPPWTHHGKGTTGINVTTTVAAIAENATVAVTTAKPPAEESGLSTWAKWTIAVCTFPFAFMLFAFFFFLCATRASGTCSCVPIRWIITFFYYPDFQENKAREDDKKPVEIILVKFNAWEYAGCDIIWAGIIKNLFDTLLAHFGSINCRLYRLIREDFNDLCSEFENSLENQADEGSNLVPSAGPARDYATTNNQPAPEATEMEELVERNTTNLQEQQAAVEGQSSGGDPESGTSTDVTVIPYSFFRVPKHIFYAAFILLSLWSAVIVILLIALGVLQEISITASAFLVGLPASAMLGTLIKCITQTYKLAETDMLSKAFLDEDIKKGLGAMHKIKLEVKTLTDMIGYMGWLHQKEFRVVICVDDLDRCEKGRVMQVLEAVSIILSEHGAPFISVFAIDPRIIIGAIESQMEKDIEHFHEVASLNGYDYLKKIIHLPFWLPVANDTYIGSLLSALSTPSGRGVTGTQQEPANDAQSQDGGGSTGTGGAAGHDEPDTGQDRGATVRPFMAAMEELQRYPWMLTKNPRSVKRIANVLNLAVRLWCEELAPSFGPPIDEQQLALFIVLAEQWPYRLSLLAQIATDNDNGDPYIGKPLPEDSLSDVFAKNKHLLRRPDSWQKLIDFDQIQGSFEKVLALTQARLGHLRRSLMFIINLDGSLRETISQAIIKGRIQAWSDRVDHPTNVGNPPAD